MKSLKPYFLIFLFLLVLPFFCFSKEPDFQFVVWGDSQFEHPEVFEDFVRKTNPLNPAFVIHVGDMITGYSYDREKIRNQWKRFKKQISPLKSDFYPVPGNHDVTTTDTEDLYAEAWGKDRFYYSFSHKNSQFIILDTYLHQQDDTLPKLEIAWLRNQLEKNKNAENIFVFMHSPLFKRKQYDWNPLHQLFGKYPVKAVFAGHYHIYYHKKLDNIRYFILNTSGEMRFSPNHLTGYSHGILSVKVKGEDIHYAVHTKQGIFPPEAVPPDEHIRAGKFYQEESASIIPNPEKKDVQTLIKVPVLNRTNEECEYVLKWEEKDSGFEFDPNEIKFSLDPGKTRDVGFNIRIPKGRYFKSELPRLEIRIPYINKAGWKTQISSYHSLFIPPELGAVFLKGKLLLDGKTDDPAWKGAPSITTLYVDKKGTPAKQYTIVKVLYDKNNLYIGVKGEEPNPAGLQSLAHGEIPYVFADDSFEFYLDTNRDLKTFYRFMVNPKGTILSSGPKGFFSFQFDVETFVGKNFWSAEFQIPFTELKSEVPSKGSEWGFNVRRGRQQAASTVSEWSRMRGFPAQPEYFGILEFE